MTTNTTPRLAFIQACWHREIVDQGREACVAELGRQGIPPERLDVYTVPGSLEIPLQAKLLAQTGAYAAIVAAGLIVDGGIYRHEFVARTVLDALMRVQLDTTIPIISLVLTPQHFHEHATHQEFFQAHFKIKGTEAAVACVQTLENLRRVRHMTPDSPQAHAGAAGLVR
ncbi:MAG: 6,7-dimethyl-8-ribityllumazine synthase [Candidatus Tectomicrobia bacterium]|uniref:6,7-dimethyl-8-ribityllumazine synthase n=1 Tax=Tectimicrobiota bacterium TaxID=2528274 RepID=A0A937W267_UNCTE|nr:6,7-dimethyl-8-ribityllumazine synthase [Candidatus Tectomicrobia bacterium]